jgi:SPP1 gp7 family putative phage head morphogenesis protein
MKRLAILGAYFTYNQSLLSKLSQTLGFNGDNANNNEDDKVMFLTKEDPRVDKDCIRFNRKIFRLSDRFLPVPPLHYNCRCVLVPRK